MGKIYDGIIGLVVGDALGVPYEFRKRGTFSATGMTGYGTYNMPVGTWSDDSSLTLATLESIARLGCIDLDDIMRNFYNWLHFGQFTPYGTVFDVGNTTKAAISRYGNGTAPEKCGGDSIMDNGNGSLMRILPLAFINHNELDICNVSALTHAHRISTLACEVYVDIAANIIKGCEKLNVRPSIFHEYISALPDSADRIKRLKYLKRNEIKSTGYVIDSLEAALWCFLNTESYKDCVLTAVNLGEDTDTIAAIAGGLAGIYYGVGGEKGIPAEWIIQIARHDDIKKLCDTFEKKFES